MTKKKKICRTGNPWNIKTGFEFFTELTVFYKFHSWGMSSFKNEVRCSACRSPALIIWISPFWHSQTIKFSFWEAWYESRTALGIVIYQWKKHTTKDFLKCRYTAAKRKRRSYWKAKKVCVLYPRLHSSFCSKREFNIGSQPIFYISYILRYALLDTIL
jgi:hypothetical protein